MSSGGSRPADRLGSFGGRLALIAALGAAVRVAYAVAIAPGTAGLSDGAWYAEVSRRLVDGHWFEERLGAGLVPTATHPPLYPLWLALVRLVGVHGDTALRASGALLGTVTVCLVGLLGRRIAGAGVGLLAAGIAAVHPLLVAADGALLSETLYAATIVGAMLAALALLDRPTVLRAAALGGCVALAALTRPEALLLLALLVAPIVWLCRAASRWRLGAAALACSLLLVAPFVARNISVFGLPLISYNDGNLIGGANQMSTYYGRSLGGLDFCISRGQPSDEAAFAEACRRRGFAYAEKHLTRVPVVVAARVLREWSLYDPYGPELRDQGRRRLVQGIGVGVDYALFVLAVAGVAQLRRRRVALLVLLAPIAMVTIVAAVTYGSVRLRHGAEPSVIVLAAAGALSLRTVRRRSRTPPRAGPEP
ncbi:MAG: glycosyltransferase family 39 protein [Actinobacteria bacterium]|nr:glycosyltransferase family 39 protein [Actinomycetota bacterium]